MHSFFWAGALLHATVLAILGFFVLFAASKADGFVRTLGNILGIWLYILAVLAIVGAATAPMFGGRPFGFPMMDPDHQRWMHQWQSPDQPPPPPETPPAKK